MTANIGPAAAAACWPTAGWMLVAVLSMTPIGITQARSSTDAVQVRLEQCRDGCLKKVNHTHPRPQHCDGRCVILRRPTPATKQQKTHTHTVHLRQRALKWSTHAAPEPQKSIHHKLVRSTVNRASGVRTPNIGAVFRLCTRSVFVVCVCIFGFVYICFGVDIKLWAHWRQAVATATTPQHWAAAVLCSRVCVCACV